MLIMEILCTFGFDLARRIKRDDAIGAGLIGLAIRDAGKDIRDISYQEFREVIRVQLAARLVCLGIADSDRVIAEMLQLLEAKQSLFTMLVR